MGCCNDKSSNISTQEAIRGAYGKIALQGGGCCGGLSSISSEAAQALGYQMDELAVLPDGADMGLSCGNPNALAALKPGEVVLDLGSGGGFDVFLAAHKVGPSGRVIGVDMTPGMISKARKNFLTFQSQTGLSNVEFRLGEIEHLPMADNSVDVVLSNCVLNLSIDKAQVWREVYRALKPGGRVAISDIALLKPLPVEVRNSVEALVGCIAGAVLIEDTKQFVQDAGLIDAVYTPRIEYVQALKKLQDPLAKKIESILPEGLDIGHYITSVEIQAFKPQLS
jgi:arsenite methyltransferase